MTNSTEVSLAHCMNRVIVALVFRFSREFSGPVLVASKINFPGRITASLSSVWPWTLGILSAHAKIKGTCDRLA
jgi:hypothetical protein